MIGALEQVQVLYVDKRASARGDSLVGRGVVVGADER